ncbi:chemotaxis protein methyltransferase CheR [Formivibrio citricus]|uniref:Chemotaxis protein methyltransferase n=1 Tax=Formivibrio citricus TaxID=83765 RepID=A0A1I4V6N9_9NEIS|nr:protein-glutamate O-methyltransferase CheR [Formivibrio citricus]SFM96886.1 chemotaxis protein methyltransferase CheR [Formivibrio citricus]
MSQNHLNPHTNNGMAQYDAHGIWMPELSMGEFRELTELLGLHLGFRFPDSKQKLVAARLASRLRDLGLVSYHDYWLLLRRPEEKTELQRAIDLVTTNETSFFREPSHFDFLRDELIPPLAKQGRPVRIWSAACSTGQEPYSIAMTLAESLGMHADWQVLATDISERVLAHARHGLYAMHDADQISLELLKKYCLKGNGEYEGQFLIERALRNRVRFSQVNLMNAFDPELAHFDGVFLRNVMIYLESDRRDEMIERLKDRINPGGYLIVGQAESMAIKTSGFTLVQPSIYRRNS